MKPDHICAAGIPILTPNQPVIDIEAERVEVVHIATERPPGEAHPDPKEKGDIIGWTSYTAEVAAPGTSGGRKTGEQTIRQSIVVLDFVSDPLLFKASKGVRGWLSVRTEPRVMDDHEKARQVRSLQNYVFAKVVCNLDVLTGGKESA